MRAIALRIRAEYLPKGWTVLSVCDKAPGTPILCNYAPPPKGVRLADRVIWCSYHSSEWAVYNTRCHKALRIVVPSKDVTRRPNPGTTPTYFHQDKVMEMLEAVSRAEVVLGPEFRKLAAAAIVLMAPRTRTKGAFHFSQEEIKDAARAVREELYGKPDA